MKLPTTSTLLSLLSLTPLSQAHLLLLPKIQLGPDDPFLLRRSTASFTGESFFPQLISHSSPKQGIFAQKYWYSTEFYTGPGAPVIVFSPGELAAAPYAEQYLTAEKLPGRIAKAVGGAIVVVEHRYYGDSVPLEPLTEENLQHLTVENALRDMQYFARKFEVPFRQNGTAAGNATGLDDGGKKKRGPWVFTGGSYAGALAGWLSRLEQQEEQEEGKERAFWAYYGSSAVVEGISDFWQYFVPVLEAMPMNCTKDVERVVEFVDGVLDDGTPEEKDALKQEFGLEDLADDDFAQELSFGMSQLQMTQFFSEEAYGKSQFYQFCDYVEGTYPATVNMTVPGEEGIGVERAVEGYARWVKEQAIPGFCNISGYAEWKHPNSTLCLQNSNASSLLFTDLEVENWGNRQWWWLLCNEPFEWWQDTLPFPYPKIVSKRVTSKYDKAMCTRFFPNTTFNLAEGKTAKDVNFRLGGWDSTINVTRTMHTNGEHDPWRDATLSSKFRPGGPVTKVEEDGLQVRLVKGGTHCSDLYGGNWELNDELEKLVEDVVGNMTRWIGNYYKQEEKAGEKARL
ncbi:putative serine protease [Triangularia verruculosa]|uniref:Serine protease n=1 Tax=Triangularia verruculosa TaxID=2587418 RepID=A0AAN6XLG1_9PEZI|nr:putative serine protease [Triangularia verruculosa]